MDVLASIKSVQIQLSRRHRKHDSIFALFSLGCVLLAAISSAFWSPQLGWVIGSIGVLLLALFCFRKKYFRQATLEEAAVYIDSSLGTKQRALSFVGLTVKALTAGESENAVSALLSRQIKHALITAGSTGLEVSTELPAKSRRFMRLLPGVWLCALVLGLLLWDDSRPVDSVVLLQKLLKDEADLPQPVRKGLEKLAQTIQTSAGEAEVKEALEQARQELREALENSKAGESAVDLTVVEAPKLADSKPEREDAAPSPKKDEAQAADSPQEPPQSEPSAPQEKDKQKQQGQKQTDQGEAEGEKGEGSGQADSKDKAGQEGDGQGEGKEGTSTEKAGESGQGTGQAEGQDSADAKGDQAGEQGDTGEAQGQQEGDSGQSAGKAGDGEPGQSGKESNEQQEKENSGQGAQQLEKVEDTLNKVEDLLEQEKQEKQEKQGKSEGDQPDKGGDSKNSDKQQKPESDEGGSKDSPGKGSQQQPDAESEGAPNAERAGERGEDGQKAAANPQAEQQVLAEGQGKPREVDFKGEEKFEELAIPAGEEQLDLKQSGSSAEVVIGKEGGGYKTELKDVELARPDVVGERRRQPIPLEYRDVLK